MPSPASVRTDMTAPDLDALIEHLVNAERRLTVAFAKVGVDSSVLNDMRLLSNAAIALRKQGDALVQLRDENARLIDRLEAQFKRLTSMDGLLANAEAEVARIEAERDALREPTETMIVAGVKTLLTGHDSQRHYVAALWRRMFDAARKP